MNREPSLRFRQVVDHTLTNLTWHDGALKELGIEGISQIWSEEPAWYLWLSGRAYLFRYACLEEIGDELTGVLHAFPTQEEFNNETFSADEVKLLEPEHYDQETTTPRFESFELFKEAFVIGEVTIVMGSAGPAALSISSYRGTWELAWKFMDVFVAMQCLYRKIAPCADPTVFSPQPGICSALILFEEQANVPQIPQSRENSTYRLPAPSHWEQMAHGQVNCSAMGACSCRH